MTQDNQGISDEAREAIQRVVESGQAKWYLSAGEKIEFTAAGFCAWYDTERQRIREQAAQELEDESKRDDKWAPSTHTGIATAAQILRGDHR